ncbi:hypothetical protein O181_070355 [Austropuccinia psidii MF-1]|uniref:Uncharacterized protein n=1 Tax=Austropuccinia psidii MF-1 TaxID=1389203 RepID=A0A9Q3EWA6_9BASI|nr:hypothetical protein [Austropuccinia psidii MF-1]
MRRTRFGSDDPKDSFPFGFPERTALGISHDSYPAKAAPSHPRCAIMIPSLDPLIYRVGMKRIYTWSQGFPAGENDQSLKIKVEDIHPSQTANLTIQTRTWSFQ